MAGVAMRDFAMLLKSHRGDADYAHRLLESFHRHNRERLHLFVSVPSSDADAFADLAHPDVTLLHDELLAAHLVDAPLGDLRTGYANQEIVKLAFWELGLAANYLCVDSDAVFIADFGLRDFLRDDGVPYTVLVEDRDLAADPAYYRAYWEERQHALRRIQEAVGLDDSLVRTCHGHQVLSAEVLRSFRDRFLAPRGWDYRDAIAYAPYEFSWYNMWLQADQTIPILVREPYAKVFHHEGHHLEAILRGQRTEDLARSYLLVVINSSYSRDLGLIDPSASKPDLLAPYLSYGETASLIAAKIRGTWRRRIGRLRPRPRGRG